jgi:spermidine synthase
MFFSGYCGIIAELSLFTLAESLIGGTLINLLATMGVMMFCMGLGALGAGQVWMSSFRYGAFITLELFISLSVAISIPIITHLAGWWPGQTHWAFITASACIGTLIGMEIPLMQKIMQDETHEDIQVIASRVMMADYFGSLCAFILFSSQLLHVLGVSWTALSSALLNFSIALLVSFKKKCPPLGRYACLGFTPLLIIFSTQLDSIMEQGEQGLYRHKIIWREQTPYQNIVLVDQNLMGGPHYEEARYQKWQSQMDEIFSFDTQQGKASLASKNEHYSLFINGGLQFNSLDEGAYHEHLVHPLMALVPQAKHILIMGAGDGLAIRELLKYPQIEQIELVELDPAMTHAFSTHPILVKLNQGSLLNPKVHITNQDAWTTHLGGCHHLRFPRPPSLRNG